MIITPQSTKSFFENKKVISFDTESFRYLDNTEMEYQELANYSMYDGLDYYNGITVQEFIKDVKLLLKKYNNIILSAHNIKYDLANLNLINEIIKKSDFCGLEQKIIILGNVNYIKYSDKSKKSIEFLDSMNYFSVKLEKIAQGLNLEKYASHEDYSLEPDKWNKYILENGKELCQKDCYILYKLYENMILNKNIIWAISIASSSFRTFLNKYLKYNINLSDFNQICIDGYHGGRTEAYNLNFQDYAYDLDINSLYPAVMRKYKYSISFRQEIRNVDPNYLLTNIENQSYNYLLNIDYEIIGDVERIPIMININKKLLQLKSSKNVLITGNEYYSLQKDFKVKIKINKCYEFRNADLFSGFIDFFYNEKSTGNPLFHMFYKKILNSLYGKFGQHKAFTKYTHIDNVKDENLKNILIMNKNKQRINYNGFFYSIYGDYITELEYEEPKYAVLIAMEVTANARLYNYELQKQLGFKNVLYTDTDSFFIPEMTENAKNMIGDDIGMLKIEKEGKFQAHAPKDYIFYNRSSDEKEITLKGIPKKAVKIDDNTYEYDTIKYIKMRSNHNIIVQKVVKTVNHDNDKLKFDNGIGIVWESEEEYLNYKKVVIKR